MYSIFGCVFSIMWECLACVLILTTFEFNGVIGVFAYIGVILCAASKAVVDIETWSKIKEEDEK